MVTQKFVDNLNMHIGKELQNVLAGPVTINPIGSTADQFKGLGDELKTAIIPFRKSQYDAQEYLFVRIPVRNQFFSYFDMVTPILNVKHYSVQGVASFVTSIRYPVPDTFVERMVGLSYRLLPHKLVVEQKEKPKKVLKGNMITSNAVNSINSDKKLCNKLEGSSDCKIPTSHFKTAQIYKIKFDNLEYPAGMFTIVPYHGHSILIAKEAGDYGAMVDKPKYRIKERYEAFSGVAQYIASSPQAGEQVGKFYMDTPLNLILPPLLQYLKK